MKGTDYCFSKVDLWTREAKTVLTTLPLLHVYPFPLRSSFPYSVFLTICFQLYSVDCVLLSGTATALLLNTLPHPGQAVMMFDRILQIILSRGKSSSNILYISLFSAVLFLLSGFIALLAVCMVAIPELSVQIPAQPHHICGYCHKIISTAISRFIEPRRAIVSCWRNHVLLLPVNNLRGLNLPRNCESRLPD